jgi:hypothetical protein
MYLTDYRVNGKRSLRHAERNVELLHAVFGFDKALDITADRIAEYTAARLEAGKQPATTGAPESERTSSSASAAGKPRACSSATRSPTSATWRAPASGCPPS